ncbi:MAG: NAD(P)-dependent oxidoreductase, partial [Ilumatobacteraceae bacterium]
RYGPPTMDDSALPVLFFDGGLPDLYRDLVEGRAIAVGPDDADLARADAAIAGAKRPWDRTVLTSCRQMRVVSRLGVGYDNVNLADADAAGIVVCYAPHAPTVSTAEHTIALMLAITKQIPVLQARATAGLPGAGTSTSLELDGAMLGLVGLGRIASRVALAAQGLGMTVVAHDPFLEDSPIPGVGLVALDELLTMSDVVSLHAPALPETERLINAGTLARMKPGSYLVNCARGALVDQDALLDALDSGHVAGAALDVTDPEPLPAGHPLLGRDDVIVTPHIASSTAAGRRRLYEHAIENALAVLRGESATIVTPPSI